MLRDILFTPWKLNNGFQCLLSYPLVWIICASEGIHWGKGWKFYGLPIIQKHRNSEMIFGENLQLRSTIISNPLGPNHPVIISTLQIDAHLHIGNNFGMTGGSIIAAESILIGNNVTVGSNSAIIDTDFHPLVPYERLMNPQNAKTAPIIIEDNVFVGMNCLILKGVTIGEGSVIGAGSVVTKNIPSGVVVAGNPAKVIRKIGTE